MYIQYNTNFLSSLFTMKGYSCFNSDMLLSRSLVSGYAIISQSSATFLFRSLD